jgi:hypothetical protein
MYSGKIAVPPGGGGIVFYIIVIIDYNIISLEPKPNNNLQLIGINKTVV